MKRIDDDSRLFADFFSSAAMRAIFGDAGMVQRWLDVEATLAEVEAEVGLIPKSAAIEIRNCAKAELLDAEKLSSGIAKTEHPLVSTIWALAEICRDGAGDYVHWGVTTQDVMDTTLALQLKDAIEVFEGRLREIIALLADLSAVHRDAIMAGRTHGQHALPITFGFKTAVWLSELLRDWDRIEDCKPRLLVGQFSGAAGTLASLGEAARRVQTMACEKLGLASPIISWHSSRDTIAEFASCVAILASTCAKVCSEIILLQKTEVAELEEAQKDGNVGSSTMPQKRNPMTCEGVVAAWRIIRSIPGLALDTSLHQHERDMSAWQAEWEYIPRLCQLVDAVLIQTSDVLGTLEVNTQRMAENVTLTRGLIMGEAIMLRLGETMGRQRAHELVHDIAKNAFESSRPFADCLIEDERVAAAFGSSEEIRELLDPGRYLGLAPQLIDAVVRESRARLDGN